MALLLMALPARAAITAQTIDFGSGHAEEAPVGVYNGIDFLGTVDAGNGWVYAAANGLLSSCNCATGDAIQPTNGSATTPSEAFFQAQTPGERFSIRGVKIINLQNNDKVTVTGFRGGAPVGSFDLPLVKGTSWAWTHFQPFTLTTAQLAIVVNVDRVSFKSDADWSFAIDDLVVEPYPPPPPTVGTMSPTLGPAAGGTSVTITGSGFKAALGVTAVNFGAAAASSFTVVSDTQVTATAPAGTGAVAVRVSTAGGASAIVGAATFTYLSPPTVNAVSITVPYGSGASNVPLAISGAAATSVAVASAASHGVAVSSGTAITYAPASGYYGSDSFTYTASNANGTSAPATVTVTVNPPAPVANPVSATVAYGSTGNTITLNIAGPATSVAVAGTASHGTAAATGTTISYTPTAGYSGPDSFTYTATNAGGTSAPATVTVTVNPQAPVAGAVSVTVAYGSAGNPVTLSLSGGPAASVAVTGAASHGTASATGTTISYTPTAGYSGSDSFTYTATNAGGTSAPATVTVTVNPQAPVAGAVSVTVAYGSAGNPITLNLTGGPAASVAVTGAASHGTATASGTSISYTPTAGYAGPDSFTYTATNAGGTSAPATVTVTVNPQAPVAGAVSVTVAYGSAGNPITLNLTGGPAASVAVTGAASHGTATASGTSITYTPTAGYAGPDSFTYTATNAGGTSAPATVTVTVNPQAPVAGAVSVTVAYGSAGNPVTLSLSGGAAASVAVASAASHGTATASGTSITYTPTAGYSGSDSFTYTATNAGGTSAPAAVTVTVSAPTMAVGPATLPDGQARTSYAGATLLASGGTGPYTYAVDLPDVLPAGLTLDSTTGGLTGVPTAAGSFTFVVRATDSSTGLGAPFSATRSYTVQILPSSLADLSALGVSPGTLTPGFDAATTAYTVDLPHAQTSVTLAPVAADVGATVGVNGHPATDPVALAVGDNAVSVVVTAEDGTVKTYQLTVRRAPLQAASGAGETLGIQNPGANCTLAGAQFIARASLPAGMLSTLPATYAYPFAAVDFSATQCAPGSDLRVTLTFPAAIPANAVLLTYRANATPAWQPLVPDSIVGNQVVYTVRDDGPPDNDRLAGGFAVPAIIGVPLSVPVTPVAVPALNPWALAWLSALAALLGWRRVRPRRG